MARPLDQQRRAGILQTAKSLFAEKGFAATSMADIVRKSGFPVGSIYTYFRNKEDLIRTIIEEGWAGFRDEMAASLAALPPGRARVESLIMDFLPKLLEDQDLVGILLNEGVQFADIRAKIDSLSVLVVDAIAPMSAEFTEERIANEPVFTRRTIAAGISALVLGVLDASRLASRFDLGFSREDILEFIRRLAANSNLFKTV